MIPAMSRAVLVTGATGKQGGALVRALLAADADLQILAVTRDAKSPSAQRLTAKSSKIRVIQGNLDDTEAIFKTAQNATASSIWGVYSIQVRKFLLLYERRKICLLNSFNRLQP